MKQIASTSCSINRVKTLLFRSLLDETEVYNAFSLARGEDPLSAFSLLEYVKSGIVGVWDSQSHGCILWRKVIVTYPMYVPLGIVSDSGLITKVTFQEYRAIVLDLNNALLQNEGFE